MRTERNISDSELTELLRDDREDALTTIFQRYWQPLYMAAFNVLKDKQACEDIIQDIFIKLWTKRKEIEISVSLKAYLFACMRYETYRQIRFGNVREDIFDQIYERLRAPEHITLEHKELIEQIASIIEILPEKCKKVYKLSREEHLSHKEIARLLNISTKTVETHLTKALRLLRVSLGLAATIKIINILVETNF